MFLNDDEVRAAASFSYGARLAGSYVAALMAFGFGLLVSFKLGTANAVALGGVIVCLCGLYLTVFASILLFRAHRMREAK